MLNFDIAKQIVLNTATTTDTEHIGMMDSVGRILAENIYSDVDMPLFNKSAMDGYACRSEDIGKELDVLEIIPAGYKPQKEISALQCSKIMTGAEVPKGADCVVMVEYSEEIENGKVKFTIEKTKPNICLQGEDVKKGETAIEKGTLLKSRHIATMASVGCVNPLVYRQMKVGILTTGSELVEPDTKLTGSKIRNSNGHLLVAQVLSINCKANYYGIVHDNFDNIKNVISKAIDENDVVVISGGVSVGDFDFVPEVLKQLKITLKFDLLAVKPGKHTLFGTRDKKTVFALPGNPVSSFVQFELLVKPFLYACMGHNFRPFVVPLKMEHNHKRKKTDRLDIIPVRITPNYTVEIVKYNGSAHIHALTYSGGLIEIPTDIQELKKGDIVYVRQF